MSNQTPRMVGNNGLTVEEKDRIWELHVAHNISATAIGIRMGIGKNKISVFLKQRRTERGVEVKIDRFAITRPMV